jgi:hypothetical protein
MVIQSIHHCVQFDPYNSRVCIVLVALPFEARVPVAFLVRPSPHARFPVVGAIPPSPIIAPSYTKNEPSALRILLTSLDT